jgi:DivIVA domain-containing protein
MGQVLLLLVVALTVAAVVFGVTVLVTGGDPGLGTAEPDGRAVPLPGTRPLMESDVSAVRFDTTVRGYRMAQVDQALRRAAYDIGYKDELIGVLEAEVIALREGRSSDADVLRRAREAALAPAGAMAGGSVGAGIGPAVPPAGVVDLGEVSLGARSDEDADDDEHDERAKSETAVAEEPEDLDDEVDTDADLEPEAEADDDANDTDEDGDEGAEPEDDVDTDARAALPDRDERA